jgi:hypothetical protein
VAKTWVLDTETKGTGAHIAPLKRAPDSTPRELATIKLKPPAGADEAPAAPVREGLRFKVVDVLSGRVLGEDIELRAAIELLRGLRSALDARIYERVTGSARWRLLTLAEQRTLWSFRERALSSRPSAGP